MKIKHIATKQAEVLSELLAIDFDSSLPEIMEGNQNDFTHTRSKIFKDIAEQDKLTVLEMVQMLFRGRGQKEIIGTPKQVADEMQLWLETEAADGFNLLPASNSDSIKDFVELVVPELQKRGIFKKEYAGTTLRENLGLKSPNNSFIKN